MSLSAHRQVRRRHSPRQCMRQLNVNILAYRLAVRLCVAPEAVRLPGAGSGSGLGRGSGLSSQHRTMEADYCAESSRQWAREQSSALGCFAEVTLTSREVCKSAQATYGSSRNPPRSPLAGVADHRVWVCGQLIRDMKLTRASGLKIPYGRARLLQPFEIWCQLQFCK